MKVLQGRHKFQPETFCSKSGAISACPCSCLQWPVKDLTSMYVLHTYFLLFDPNGSRNSSVYLIHQGTSLYKYTHYSTWLKTGNIFFYPKTLLTCLFLHQNMLWVLTRSASLRHFLWVPTTYVFLELQEKYLSGPSCSKLMMSFVNISLKLWSLNMAYTGCYSHFFSKNTYELDIVLTMTVNVLTTTKLVKLTMLWTTGPWIHL